MGTEGRRLVDDSVQRRRSRPDRQAVAVVTEQQKVDAKHARQRLRIDRGTLIMLVLILALAGVSLLDRHEQGHRNCRAIENLKAGQRERAQVAIDGENTLLRVGGITAVRRQVLIANRRANREIVARYPPRDC